jgi:L,D-peptidoglycan transpeptidase YkuD (ErfK/YbiS/YcfS/YnhG family)
LIRIRATQGNRSEGVMLVRGQVIPVTLGRGGILTNKHEGDGGTPRGIFHPLRLWWRRDRTARPRTSLPSRAIGPTDAWCEDPADRRYNRNIHVATEAAGDRLMRADHLYDYIVEIDHNTRPRISGRGSAVFIHLARENFGPTAGCVGLKRNDMLRLLEKLTRRTRIVVG